MAKTIHVLGQGGVAFVVDSDLEYVQAQLLNGMLQQVDAPEATDLAKLNKAALLELASTADVEVDASATKAEIIAALSAQPEDPAVDADAEMPEDPAAGDTVEDPE